MFCFDNFKERNFINLYGPTIFPLDKMNEEEEQVFKREFEHFLTEIVPSEWNIIINELKQAFEILRGKFSVLNLFSQNTQPNSSGDLVSPSPQLDPFDKYEKKDEKKDEKTEKKQNFEYITFQIGQFV